MSLPVLWTPGGRWRAFYSRRGHITCGQSEVLAHLPIHANEPEPAYVEAEFRCSTWRVGLRIISRGGIFAEFDCLGVF